MAIWQFVLFLVPAAEAQVNGLDVVRISYKRRKAMWIKLSNIDKEKLFARFDAMLPPLKDPWPNSRYWGDGAHDDISVHFHRSGIRVPHVRLDARAPSDKLVRELCALARDFDWRILVAEKSAVIPPSSELLLAHFKKSRAAALARA